MRGWARTDHFGRFGPCLNTIPFWTLHSYLFRLSTLLSIIYSIHSQCHLSGNTGDVSLPCPWVHNLITRHSTMEITFPPFLLLCAMVPFPFFLPASSALGCQVLARANEPTYTLPLHCM